MQPLFAGENFSVTMNARLTQLEAEIQKLKCGDLENLTEEQLSAKADMFADKYAANRIPKIDRTLQKTECNEGTGKKSLLVPFSGDKAYFTCASVVAGEKCYADIVDGQWLRIDFPEETAQAELKMEENLTAIEKALDALEQYSSTNFPREKFKQLAESVMNRKRESCAKLRAKGYSVR
jgi:hypothetical protein